MANPLSVKRPAAFFDRDGVLNFDDGFTFRQKDFTWTPGALAALRICHQRGFHCFIVSNQGGISRGLYSVHDVYILTEWIHNQVKEAGGYIDHSYFCPHHPDGHVPPWNQLCLCRKPAPGMILQAMADFPILKPGSFLIGDRQTDMQAAAAAGILGVLWSDPSADLATRVDALTQKDSQVYC